tara:strand:+ start:418 stop:621 length:204 start_codon:yes stop_codon:yes gene_type:complete
MGRAIEDRKDIDVLQREILQLKRAFEGLASEVETLKAVSTTRTNVDLHETPKKKKRSKVKVVEEAEA